MADDTFESDKLQVLLDASPPDLFLGFSSISGDGVCLNRGLDRLPDEQRQLLVTTMEKGGKLKAAKEIVAGGDLKEIIAAANRISAALVQLREEFETASRAYTPPV